jgi:hypothetical protein
VNGYWLFFFIKEDRELAGILGASIRTAQAKASRISKSPFANHK